MSKFNKEQHNRGHRSRKITASVSLVLLVIAALLFSLQATASSESIRDLKSFDLEDLAMLEVSIAGKRPQKLTDIPAAVYVLSEKDIRVSGANKITDLLRLVPGLQVAQIDANKWAVSARGFNSRITNKLLVMIDGRSIYSSLFGGVWWDQYDLMLKDIERIEVIRGPGAAIWGANAVNGVINIITKHTEDTQGTLINSIIGTEGNILSVRHGDEFTQDGYYRLYAKYREQEESLFLDDSTATDAWDDYRAGFRLDWETNKTNTFSVQGNTYQGKLSEQLSVPTLTAPSFERLIKDEVDIAGFNIMGHWARQLESGANSELKIYYDYSERDQWVIKSERDVLEASYQYHYPQLTKHDVIIGAAYRYVSDDLPVGDLSNLQVRVFSPVEKTTHQYSAFFQDDITLKTERWWLTLGAKIEHNDYTGVEVQPSLRLRWKPRTGHLLWSAVSKSVRTPTRADHDGFTLLEVVSQGPPPLALLVSGSDSVKSEVLQAIELGYRFERSENFNFDLSFFYHDYDDVVSYESSGLIPAPVPLPFLALGVLLTADNKLTAKTYGVEASLLWRPTDNWYLRAAYTQLNVKFNNKRGGTDTESVIQEGLSPDSQFSFLSGYDFSPTTSINIVGRYMGELASAEANAYLEIDANIEWKLSDSVSLSLAGRNLLNPDHIETRPQFFATTATKIEREFYLTLTVAF